MQEFQELMERTVEPRKKEKIQSALHDIAMRVQDLRTMEEVHSQFFVSIEMTRQNITDGARGIRLREHRTVGSQPLDLVHAVQALAVVFPGRRIGSRERR